MTYIVTDACIGCRYTDCVSVCPVSCFKAGPDFLVIDPDECIDCGVCVPECPVEAIYSDVDLPAEQQHFLELNRRLAAAWPQIADKEPALASAEARRGEKNKLALLDQLL